MLLAGLALVGLAAGFVDAVAGGGGLIALPSLLAAGVHPVAALATNKLQGSIGTFIAALTYWRKGLVDLRSLAIAIVATFAGAYLGSASVKAIDVSALRQVVPFALIAIALYFLVAPRLGDEDRAQRLARGFIPVMGFCIGFYDGIFGPGTGSFLTIGFVVLFGFGLTRATANTKALNFVSNAASLALFIPSGDVLWPIALAMAAGQIIGGYLGAHAGIRHGARFIRPLVVVVSIVMALRLLFWN
ncbi:MAG: TSUP family transporter [Hyphomicrobiaceae bacterium]|nr:TSUP family transporter [Hyphomicrobiaceae bacterium]